MATGTSIFASPSRPIDDDPVGGLMISTENEEVTVQCGRHCHSHFSSSPDALAFIAEVLSEERVFVRYEHGGGVLGGKSMDASAAKTLIESGPPTEPFHPRVGVVADAVSLWSWRGTFDRTLRR